MKIFKKYKIVIIVTVLIVIIVLGYLLYQKYKSNKNSSPEPSPSSTFQTSIPTAISSPIETQNQNTLVYPIAEFKTRITKKPFGIYITPATSPVQPERFTGYHTGTDIEYMDVTTDVPVYAIADGTVTLARTASGYGGVMIIEVDIDGAKHSVLYGHIRPYSLPQVGQKVSKGEQIGLLGTGYSTETDGERRHLHFAVLSNNRIDLLGYVQNKSQLSGWIDPVTLY